MKKNLFIGGTTLLLSILFGAFFTGPLTALAQNATSTTTASTAKTNPYCQQYLLDVSKRLNVSIATLKQARMGAKVDVLAQLVKDGKLTQTQANRIQQRLGSFRPCNTKSYGGGREMLRATIKKYAPALLSQVALGLHLSAGTLRSDLMNGQTLNQIAKAQNVSASQLHTLVLNAISNTLSQAQKAGDLTSQQVNGFLQYLQTHPGVVDQWFNRSFKK